MLVGANYGETGATNQIAGDQSGREVRVKPYYVYRRGWNCVLRPKDSFVADIIARCGYAMCKNDHIGYDYTGRNTAYRLIKASGWDASKVTTDCETDCSALVTTCCAAAGIPEKYLLLDGWNCLTTYVMRTYLMNSGFFELLTDSKYLTSETYLKHGDILLNDNYHVEICYKDAWEGMNKTEYVKECYASLLYRNASDKEAALWADSNKNPQEVLKGIAYSKEGIQEWIKTIYQLMLGRKVDAGGLKTWTAAMQKGATRGDIIDKIKASAEYKKLHS